MNESKKKTTKKTTTRKTGSPLGETPHETGERVSRSRHRGDPRTYKMKKPKEHDPENPVHDHTEYDPEQILQVLENNIRRFIAENDDHVAAAQFVVDHKQEIINELFGFGSKGTARIRSARRSAARTPAAQARMSASVTASRAARAGRQGKERQRKVQGRKDLASWAHKATVGRAKGAVSLAGEKLKDKFHGAVKSVKGGISGAGQRVADAAGKFADKHAKGAAEAGASQVTAQARAGTALGKVRDPHGIRKDPTVQGTPSQRKGSEHGQVRGNRGGKGTTFAQAGAKQKNPSFRETLVAKERAKRATTPAPAPAFGAGVGKKGQGKFEFASHDWAVESAYQLHRLHENLQRFNG